MPELTGEQITVTAEAEKPKHRARIHILRGSHTEEGTDLNALDRLDATIGQLISPNSSSKVAYFKETVSLNDKEARILERNIAQGFSPTESCARLKYFKKYGKFPNSSDEDKAIDELITSSDFFTNKERSILDMHFRTGKLLVFYESIPENLSTNDIKHPGNVALAYERALRTCYLAAKKGSFDDAYTRLKPALMLFARIGIRDRDERISDKLATIAEMEGISDVITYIGSNHSGIIKSLKSDGYDATFEFPDQEGRSYLWSPITELERQVAYIGNENDIPDATFYKIIIGSAVEEQLRKGREIKKLSQEDITRIREFLKQFTELEAIKAFSNTIKNNSFEEALSIYNFQLQ